MVLKRKVFGTGIGLFAPFWCSVANMPTASGALDDWNKKEVGAIWCKDYIYDSDMRWTDLDAHGKLVGVWPIQWYKNGFYSEMTTRGWGGNHSGVHGDGLATRTDLSWNQAGTPWGENMDILYYSGHGFDGGIKFRDASSISGNALPQDDGWGRVDLEWVIFSACRPLYGGLSYWGDNQETGLHILNGYLTDSYEYGYWEVGDCWPRGKRYAIYLFESGTQGGFLKRAVGFAWQRATWDDAHDPFNLDHYYIVGAAVAAASDNYVNGQYIGTTHYFYEDTIDSQLRDPFDKLTGNVQYDCYAEYYSWVADTP